PLLGGVAAAVPQVCCGAVGGAAADEVEALAAGGEGGAVQGPGHGVGGGAGPLLDGGAVGGAAAGTVDALAGLAVDDLVRASARPRVGGVGRVDGVGRVRGAGAAVEGHVAAQEVLLVHVRRLPHGHHDVAPGVAGGGHVGDVVRLVAVAAGLLDQVEVVPADLLVQGVEALLGDVDLEPVGPVLSLVVEVDGEGGADARGRPRAGTVERGVVGLAVPTGAADAAVGDDLLVVVS